MGKYLSGEELIPLLNGIVFVLLLANLQILL